LDYIKIGESKMPVPSDDTFKMWMRFTKEGVHKVNTKQGVRNGKWEFTKNKDSILITNFRGDVKALLLNALSENELVLTTKEAASLGTMGFKENKIIQLPEDK